MFRIQRWSPRPYHVLADVACLGLDAGMVHLGDEFQFRCLERVLRGEDQSKYEQAPRVRTVRRSLDLAIPLEYIIVVPVGTCAVVYWYAEL